jgi:hypothetical protein
MTDPQSQRCRYLGAPLQGERDAFNAAIAQGVHVMLHTAVGDFPVRYVDPQHWYHVERPEGWGLGSFAGCNDAQWAALLHHASVQRHSDDGRASPCCRLPGGL